MLKTKNLSFAYKDSVEFVFPDLNCQKEETHLILGKSGSGKSTLLHLLGLLNDPNGGLLEIDGQNTLKLNNVEKTRFRAKNIGIVYQKPYFVDSLNVIDNILIANYLANKKQDKSRAVALAETLGFASILNKKVQNLSGGEQQRVGIARALMNRPALILADEPTSALDDENCQIVSDLLQKEAKNAGSILVIVTHDQRLKNQINNQITLK